MTGQTTLFSTQAHSCFAQLHPCGRQLLVKCT
jgi:hypothetical protein